MSSPLSLFVGGLRRHVFCCMNLSYHCVVDVCGRSRLVTSVFVAKSLNSSFCRLGVPVRLSALPRRVSDERFRGKPLTKPPNLWSCEQCRLGIEMPN
jgi:hypothetical protein